MSRKHLLTAVGLDHAFGPSQPHASDSITTPSFVWPRWRVLGQSGQARADLERAGVGHLFLAAVLGSGDREDCFLIPDHLG